MPKILREGTEMSEQSVWADADAGLKMWQAYFKWVKENWKVGVRR